MRYPASHKTTTRERILDEAGQLAKERGFATTGVDALMAAAGLTAGAFYAHFASKSELLSALVERELKRSQRMFAVDSDAALEAAIGAYLSPQHVERPRKGCPLPTLSSEVARADDTVRSTYARGLAEVVQQLAQRAGSEEKAWPMVAQAVGAVTLARALPAGRARKTLLDSVRDQVIAALRQPEGETAPPTSPSRPGRASPRKPSRLRSHPNS
ncbi:TetR family transcriptional regulator [Panacagrimonas perspica]|uniref:TetR family transcriptional regulator n=1 Tax=Panacagrimonas perspica TaxID=381431 RepID=A0A4R7NX89_9GAMM|nr:TetR/AcrR family transcriptional regulator [Panacagrimonas perspica]TDU25718.1 TetR family transcriptional regulator [Panacagrimonas perspica]THD00726.1 hypothetical protein B1810_23310 [Panacagrimonas perspica]